MKVVFAQNAKPMTDQLVLIGCVTNMRLLAQNMLRDIALLPPGHEMDHVTVTMSGKLDPASNARFQVKE